MINVSNFFIAPPKTFQFILGVAGKRNTDFVRFVTILPIFAAKRPDYTVNHYASKNLGTRQIKTSTSSYDTGCQVLTDTAMTMTDVINSTAMKTIAINSRILTKLSKSEWK